MKISNQVSGRFGNNLFQYLASKVLQYKLTNTGSSVMYVFNDGLYENTVLKDPFIVSDDNYFEILNNPSQIPKDKDVYLQGYFQFDKHIIENKDYVNSIFNVFNFEKINNIYTVSFVANNIRTFNRRYKADEVVMHLRLDDFIGDRIVMHYNNYFEMLTTLPSSIKTVVVVVDKCKYQWEITYLRTIQDFCSSKNLTVKFDTGDMFDDFCKLYYAQNLMSSNSTFSYLAGLLGTHKLTWCPVNSIYSHQKISKFDENTISIKVEYL